MKKCVMFCGCDPQTQYECGALGANQCPISTRLVNLTPHDITIVGKSGNTTTIPASGQVARVSASTMVVGSIGDIPITATTFGEIEGLPDMTYGVRYIVSRLVAEAAYDRTDLFVTNETVRDDGGRIIGCRSLARL